MEDNFTINELLELIELKEQRESISNDISKAKNGEAKSKKLNELNKSKNDLQNELKEAQETLLEMDKPDEIGQQKKYIQELEKKIASIQKDIDAEKSTIIEQLNKKLSTIQKKENKLKEALNNKIEEEIENIENTIEYCKSQIEDLEESIKMADESQKEVFEQALAEAKEQLAYEQEKKEKISNFDLEELLKRAECVKELVENINDENKKLQEEIDNDLYTRTNQGKLKKNQELLKMIEKDVFDNNLDYKSLQKKAKVLLNNFKRKNQVINVGGYEMTRGQALEELTSLYSRLEDEPDLDSIDDPDYNKQAILDRIAQLEEALGISQEIEDPEGPRPDPPGPDPDPPGPGPDPDPPGPGPSRNLPIRSFWEIYNDTCSEHAGNLAIKLHQFAHMSILPDKSQDLATKILSVPTIPFKLGIKILSFVPNKIMGTDRKFKRMKENIDKLRPEEFETLVSNPERVQEIYGENAKDSNDRDYLDPQFMKQYKVNELYLRAVGARLARERSGGIKFCNDHVSQIDEKLQELDNRKNNLTQEEKAMYTALIDARKRLIDQGKELSAEIDRFNEGVAKKSSGFKNISGWFLAKFNPDNREENNVMAEMSKKRRIATQRGNTYQASELTNSMKEFAEKNTSIKWGTDRGKYSIESAVEQLNKGEENRWRLFLSDFAITLGGIDLFKQLSRKGNASVVNNEMNDFMSNKYNPSNEAAKRGYARETVEARFNSGERGNLDKHDWNLKAYIGDDQKLHKEASEAANAVKTAIKNGDNEAALRAAEEYFKKGFPENQGYLFDYAKKHPDVNRSALNPYAYSDHEAVLEFLTTQQSALNAEIAKMMNTVISSTNQGINLLPAIFAATNMTGQAGRDGVKDGLRKSLKVEPEYVVPENQPKNQPENQPENKDER